MSNSLSIRQTNRKSFQQLLKTLVGRAISTASPRRTNELFAFPVSQPIGFRDKAIMAFLKRRAINKHEDTFFERLHHEFWSGQGGAVFADNCDHRFEDLFLAKQAPDFQQLQKIWSDHSHTSIVEFGCNSGLLLNYLTKKLPNVQRSTGIELNAEQVNRNQQADHFDPRINFIQAEGGQWLFEVGPKNSLFVTNGGVLEYFRRERLDAMLAHIAAALKPATFFCVEPIAEDHDWHCSKESIPFGNELSFSHNYLDLFQSNGFQIEHQRAVAFQDWKMVSTIATVH
jgi:2-polyprenyl-3-methyl-5-hydroxy-6-metoxy-1,4-benzoquinol methylase